MVSKKPGIFDQMIAEAEAREAEAKDLSFTFEGVKVKIKPEKYNSVLWQLPFQRGDLVSAMVTILDQKTMAEILESSYDEEKEAVSQVVVLKFWKAFGEAFDEVGKSKNS